MPAGCRPHIFLSVLIGSITHVVWDSFTHLNALGPELIPGLLMEIGSPPLYKWLQLISSMAGLLVLFHWLYMRWDRSRETDTAKTLWISAGWLTHGICCIGFALIATRFADSSYYLYGTIIMSMQLFFSSWLLVCVLFHSKSILLRTEDKYTARE